MSLPTSGTIKMSQIHAEFGGTEKLSAYYRGGAYVPNYAANINIPTTGTIKFSNFYGSSNFPFSWTRTTSGVNAAGQFTRCCYGNGNFMIAGNNATAHSTDGINWTAGAAPSLTSVTGCNYANAYWFILGTNSAGYPAYQYSSNAGASWSAAIQPYVNYAFGNIYHCIYKGGIYTFVGYCSPVGTYIVTQSALTSVSGTFQNSPFGTNSSGNSVNDIATNGTIVVAVGEGPTGGIIASSPTGGGWTSRATPVHPVSRIIYGGGLFAAASGTSGSIPSVYTSPDGVTWTQHVLPGSGSTADVFPYTMFYKNATTGFFTSGVYIAGTNSEWYSTTGTTWAPASGPYYDSAVGWQFVDACSNGTVNVAVGANINASPVYAIFHGT